MPELWSPWVNSAVYLDASALIKRYISEPGSDLIDSIMNPGGPRPILSYVSVIEVVSNLRRKEFVDKEITTTQFVDLVRMMLTELNLGRALNCVVGASTTERAREIVRRTYVTPADALHLATAVRLQEQNAVVPLVVVSADDRLLKIARAEALYVFNPLDPKDPGIRGVDPKFAPGGRGSVSYSDA